MKKLDVAAAGLVITLASFAHADVKVPHLFSDHMVLQQQAAKVPVWGWADPGEQVTVTLGQQRRSVTAGPDGKWRAELSDLRPGDPQELLIAGKNQIRIQDVLVGEVWFGSGQSNMDASVSAKVKSFAGVINEEQEIAAANDPQLRMFIADQQFADEPKEDVGGKWLVCSPQTVPAFSAVGYFFSRDLQRSLKTPVGMIVSAYGASTAQTWMSRQALEADPAFTPILEKYRDDCAKFNPIEWEASVAKAREAWEASAKQAKAEGKPEPRRPRLPANPHRDQHNPCLLYNGMIRPLEGYAIRGVIWYQGESNGPTADIYDTLQNALIQDWRHRWGQGDFPFLFVLVTSDKPVASEPQINSQTATLRNNALKTLRLPRTGVAVAVDVGQVKNIHPKNKQEIGRRLALVAQAKVYGEPVEYSGPMYAGYTTDGNKVRIKFTHVDKGLAVKGDTLKGFDIAGENGVPIWANAVIEGDTVVVSSPAVAKPAVVRYGWADFPPLSLFGKNGLPTPPFTIADKPIEGY